VHTLLNSIDYFLAPADAPDVLCETNCELKASYDVDQVTFKGYLARWLAKTVRLLPNDVDAARRMHRILRASAKVAAYANTCNPVRCYGKWWGAHCGGQAGRGKPARVSA
jgi:mannan endo-1,6-alpha-mannosidase